MARLNIKNWLMEQTIVYQLWQAPFVRQKLRPFYKHNALSSIHSVLDVGCGPGTNTSLFLDKTYIGVDLNPAYIRSARKRYQKSFIVADVTQSSILKEHRFDCILLNSLMHHLDPEGCRHLLSHLQTLLTPDGNIHILDLVLSEKAGMTRFLARCDRGNYPRTLEAWEKLFATYYETIVFEPYFLTGLGLKLWEMVYFKGRFK